MGAGSTAARCATQPTRSAAARTGPDVLLRPVGLTPAIETILRRVGRSITWFQSCHLAGGPQMTNRIRGIAVAGPQLLRLS